MDPKGNSEKHLLIVAQRVPFPPNKGEKLRTYYQIQWLVRQGYRITVASPLSSQQDYQDLRALRDQLDVEILCANLPPKPLRLIRGLLTGKALSEANFYSNKLRKAVLKAITDNKVDALLLAASSLYCYGSGLEIPTLMDFMDLDSDKWRKYTAKARGPMRWIYQREAKKIAQLEQQAVNHFAACLFISNAEIGRMQEVYPQLKSNNVHALGNGIDMQAFYPGQNDAAPSKLSGPVLLFVGVMNYPPNIEAVLWFAKNVWPELKNEYPDAQFIIAGMNPTPTIQTLTKKTGIQVTGFVDDILPYFHRADFFIASFQMACGVQNKILQAFACALPTLSTKVGIEGIKCDTNVHYALTDTAQEYLDTIRYLWNDREKRKVIGQNAKTLIEKNYSWDAQLTSLTQIIQKYIS